MISPGRRSAPLLAGASAGAVLIATLVLVTPSGALPAEMNAALGTPVAAPAAPPTTTRVPRPVVAIPAPVTPTTTPVPTTTPSPTPTPEPEPTPEPTPTPEPRRSDAGPAAQVVELTNAERADAGCAPLDTDPRLTAAAQGHAEDMSRNEYFDHVSRDGRRFDDRISAQGYPAPGGENIARGQQSAAEVVDAWMDSPGHRRNILDCDFTDIGVGYDDDGAYWVQNFGL